MVDRFRGAAARIRKGLKHFAESRPVRLTFWGIAGIVSALVLSFALFMIDWVVRRAPNWPIFWNLWIALTFFLVVTNLFITSRLEEGGLEPNLDIRYYARMHSVVRHEPSKFLMVYHRSAFPLELDYSYEYTINSIESALPLTLTITAVLVGAICVVSSILFNEWVAGTLALQSTVEVVIVTILLVMLYKVLDWLLFGQWDMYRRSKAFWTSLWTHIVNIFEPAEQVVDVTEYSGDWGSILPWNLVGVKVDYDDPKSIASLRKEVERVMIKHGIKDVLPENTEDLFGYLECLALLVDLKEEVEDEDADLRKAIVGSQEVRDVVYRIKSVQTIQGQLTIQQEREYRRILDLVPVALISTQAMEELKLIRDLDTDNRPVSLIIIYSKMPYRILANQIKK